MTLFLKFLIVFFRITSGPSEIRGEKLPLEAIIPAYVLMLTLRTIMSMRMDQETLDKFIELYEEYFGERLSPDEAYKRFSRVLNFVRVILYPETICQVDGEEEGGSLEQRE